MKYLSLILSLIKFLTAITGYFRDRKLIDEGEANAILEITRQADAKLTAARNARSTSDRVNTDPKRVRDDDGFKRD